MDDRFEREYTREDRAFIELENKIGAETIDCRTCKVTSFMRKWFREKFGYKADDATIYGEWRKNDIEL